MRGYVKYLKYDTSSIRFLVSRIGTSKIRNASCLLLCVLCAWSVSSQAATLEPKIGARPMGMSAFAAVADDINAISWNPAGLSLLQKQEATALYSPVYDDMNQSYLAYAYPTGKYGTIGVDLAFLDYGNMDWRDNSGTHLGAPHGRRSVWHML